MTFFSRRKRPLKYFHLRLIAVSPCRSVLAGGAEGSFTMRNNARRQFHRANPRNGESTTISRGLPRRKLWDGHNTLYDFSPFRFGRQLRASRTLYFSGRPEDDTFKSSSRHACLASLFPPYLSLSFVFILSRFLSFSLLDKLAAASFCASRNVGG